MNTITIELCAEDRKRLDKLLESMENNSAVITGTAEALLNIADHIVKKVDSLAAPAQTAQEAQKDEAQQNIEEKLKAAVNKASAPAPEPAKIEDVAPWEAPAEDIFPEPVKEEPAPAPAPDVKLADIQSLVVKLATTGKKAEARDIVKAYAERVTEIPAEKFGEVFTKLKALEG